MFAIPSGPTLAAMDDSLTDEPRGAVLDVALSPREAEMDGDDDEHEEASVDDSYVPI